MVSDAGFTELTGTVDVTLLPVVSKRFSVLLAKQPELRRCIAWWCFTGIFTNKPQLFTNEPELFTYQSEILSNEPQL